MLAPGDAGDAGVPAPTLGEGLALPPHAAAIEITTIAAADRDNRLRPLAP
jgi:hypothetical protein